MTTKFDGHAHINGLSANIKCERRVSIYDANAHIHVWRRGPDDTDVSIGEQHAGLTDDQTRELIRALESTLPTSTQNSNGRD